jgi:hypothetical protein
LVVELKHSTNSRAMKSYVSRSDARRSISCKKTHQNARERRRTQRIRGVVHIPMDSY